MNTAILSCLQWLVVFCAPCGLLLDGVALAQDRGLRPPITDQQTVFLYGDPTVTSSAPQVAAQLLLEESDLVAWGEFVNLREADSDGRDVLAPRQVTLSFRVSQVYKGSATDGSSVRIELNSDMLVYPGDDVSRYSKRLDVRRNRREELGLIRSQLAALDDAKRTGALSERQHANERARLDSRAAELAQQPLDTSSRMAFVSHGGTFYDIGAITEGELYLVGLEAISTREGTYGLDDLATNRNIFWGELADDVADALAARR